jgi:putative FmdB family regulatory protein
MPIYEYTCKACKRLTSAFVRASSREASSREAPPPCQHCGGKTARVLSRFAVGRSAAQAKSDFKAPRPAEDYSDPRQIGRWVEDKFDQYGMDLPEGAREMIDAARDGELPDAVKDL